MKHSILALFATATLAAAASDGTDSSSAPLAGFGSGLLENLFVGGSLGYLDESQEEMWNVHLGIDLQPQLGSMSQSIFVELGYNELEFFNVTQEIIPVTLNYKLEHPILDQFNLYAGVGGGVAFYDVSGAVDADDEVFWGQIFGGVVYNLSEVFEVFAGVRGVFLDEVEINGFTTETGDDLLWEFGARLNF